MQIQIVEFGRDQLAAVQNFECGNDDWSLHAAEWIKNAPPFTGALQSIEKHNNRVWLYYLADCLLGFASLGSTRWPIPPPDGGYSRIGIIPMIAVASAFQRKEFEGKKYSAHIMEHVIETARITGYTRLGLAVHEDNARAISLYRRFDFGILSGRYKNNHLRMMREK